VGFAQYRPVVANREARSALLLGTIARTPIFASWVVITLHVVTTLGRGYAAAGFAAAVVAAAVAAGSPVRGRAIDRAGLRRAIVPTLLVTAACWSAAPWLGYGWLVLLAATSGVFMVPVFAIVRMALVASVPEQQRRTALSLDAVLTEVSFMVGPFVGAWAATTWDTRWVLLLTEVAVVAGGALIWLVNPRVASDADIADGAVPRRAWMTPGFLALCGAALATVAVLQGTDLGIVATLRAMSSTGLIGPALAIWGLGSLIGGLVYGAMNTSVPVWVLLGGLAAVTAPAALARDEWTLIGLLFVAGLLCAPAMTAVVEQMSRVVPAAALGEAMGWHSSSITLGEALGAPLAGMAIDRWNPGAGFWSVAVVGLVAAALMAVVRLSGPSPAPPARPERRRRPSDGRS
jgi:predicted MFS family arabinose efflux permease